MYVRHITLRKPGRNLDQAIEDFRPNVYDVLKVCPGFVACLFFVDRASNETIGMTLWDTEENMRASGEVLHKARVARLGENPEGDEGVEVEKRFMEVHLFETS